MIISALDVVGWKMGRKRGKTTSAKTKKIEEQTFPKRFVSLGRGKGIMASRFSDWYFKYYSTPHSLLRWGRLEVCCICQVRLFWSHHDEEWDQDWIHQLERTLCCAQRLFQFFWGREECAGAIKRWQNSGKQLKIVFSSVKSNRLQAFLATVMSLGHITLIRTSTPLWLKFVLLKT